MQQLIKLDDRCSTLEGRNGSNNLQNSSDNADFLSSMRENYDFALLYPMQQGSVLNQNIISIKLNNVGTKSSEVLVTAVHCDWTVSFFQDCSS